MVSVLINKHSVCKIDKKKVEEKLGALFKESGLPADIKVSIALVDTKEMLDLSNKYLKDNKVHNVLTFPNSEVSINFKLPPGKAVDLGEIVICVPEAQKEAQEEGVTTEEKAITLIEHGALHLLGIHHE